MKTIVVATDFSPTSLNAVNYAADMACVIGTNLALLHVCIEPVAISEVPVPDDSLSGRMNDAELELDKLEEQVRQRTGERIKIFSELRAGMVVKQIEHYCALMNPYALVMGAERASAIERMLIGGHAIAAVQQLPWPVIVVPHGVQFSSIQHVALACDYRNVIETIPFHEIRQLVTETHATLHILHINRNKATTSSHIVEESAWLQEILAPLNPRYHFITNDEVDKAIASFAEQYPIDLLIVIPKKHQLVTKLFQHSHSARLVLHTHVPVMAIH
jgi:nucleotide-binding universal stress UspA family protein